MPTIDTDRISLFYEDAGKGGTPILLLHELGASSESWARGLTRYLPRQRPNAYAELSLALGFFNG